MAASMIFSATHHAVVKGFSLLTHSALSLLHRNREHNVVLEKLGVPQGWMTPCFIGIGHPREDERILTQYDPTPDSHIHMERW